MAVEKAATKIPDIVLMDIALSGKTDGIEVGNKIKASLGIPVIYISGYTMNKTIIKRAKITGPYEYHSQPIIEVKLKHATESVLSGQTTPL